MAVVPLGVRWSKTESERGGGDVGARDGVRDADEGGSKEQQLSCNKRIVTLS